MGEDGAEKPKQGGGEENPYDTEKPEASVFGKFIKTLTGQNGYHNDGSDPSFNLLNKAALGGTKAMDSVPDGQIQQYIYGDTVQHYVGSRLFIVDGDDVLRVKGTQSETVKGNTQHLYLSNFLRGVNQNDDVRVNQERHIIVLGKSSEDYASKHEINAPEEFEWKTRETGLSAAKVDLSLWGLDMHVTQMDIHESDIEFAGVKTSGFEGYETFAEQRAHLVALFNRIGASLDFIGEINAAPSLGFDLPF